MAVSARKTKGRTLRINFSSYGPSSPVNPVGRSSVSTQTRRAVALPNVPIFNDLCLFWSLDRFSREGATDTLQHLRKLTSYGVQWKSFTEQYIDSAGMFGEVIISLLAVLAKQESVRRSERASAAYQKLVSQGRTDHLGRKRLVLDRDKVRDMYKAGMSVREIARKMKISHTSAHRIVLGKA
jgi:DNA invertase Pin-like site-specific DNA recombinase